MVPKMGVKLREIDTVAPGMLYAKAFMKILDSQRGNAAARNWDSTKTYCVEKSGGTIAVHIPPQTNNKGRLPDHKGLSFYFDAADEGGLLGIVEFVDGEPAINIQETESISAETTCPHRPSGKVTIKTEVLTRRGPSPPNIELDEDRDQWKH